ncbi:MAG TPA: hypothetical protein PLD47_17085 [Aggregatilineales bacterium]|nr:hypothetical protein [Aggregatilineales bacterium]
MQRYEKHPYEVTGGGTDDGIMYIPPLLEALGLAELEHNPKSNRMKAK